MSDLHSQKSAESILEGISETTTTSEALDVLTQLVTRLFGEIRAEDGISPERLKDRKLPTTLRWWYQTVGARALCIQNHFMDPEQLEIVEDDKVVFYSENQGVYEWATHQTPDDPPVWGEFNEPDATWTLESPRLSLFLIQVCLIEFVFGAPYSASTGSGGQQAVDLLSKSMLELQLSPWHWPSFPNRFFYCDDTVAIVCPDGPEDDPYYTVKIGAKTAELMKLWADDLGADEWDWWKASDVEPHL